MPFKPVTPADKKNTDADSELNLDPSFNPDENSSQATPAWASLQGVITHSLSWPIGKSKTDDTTLHNPYFEISQHNIEYSIYCIHGTADSSYAFKKMADRLLENQPEKSHNWLPKSISKIHLLAFNGELNGVSIESYAEQLKSKIIKNKDKHVILFGHSRGGLVAAQFTENLANEIGVTVHGVFAFCAPFGGSAWAIAPLTLANSVAEMKPNSQFLTDLHASMSRSEEASQKYFYFVAGNDSLVSAENSVIKEHSKEHSLNTIFMRPHGHLSILSSMKILEPISDDLKKITTRPVEANLIEDNPMEIARLELEAEIIALKYRSHVYSSQHKLKVLHELKSLLTEFCEGNRGELFPEATTLGEFIHNYLQSPDPQIGCSRDIILKQNLTPSLSFWSQPQSRSELFINTLIQSHQTTPLPQRQPALVSNESSIS